MPRIDELCPPSTPSERMEVPMELAVSSLPSAATKGAAAQRKKATQPRNLTVDIVHNFVAESSRIREFEAGHSFEITAFQCFIAPT